MKVPWEFFFFLGWFKLLQTRSTTVPYGDSIRSTRTLLLLNKWLFFSPLPRFVLVADCQLPRLDSVLPFFLSPLPFMHGITHACSAFIGDSFVFPITTKQILNISPSTLPFPTWYLASYLLLYFFQSNKLWNCVFVMQGVLLHTKMVKSGKPSVLAWGACRLLE